MLNVVLRRHARASTCGRSADCTATRRACSPTTTCELEPGSLAARVGRAPSTTAVKSHHHQGVDGAGRGPGRDRRADADDGVVEAIELPEQAVRARRAVAPGGGRAEPRGRLARGRGARADAGGRGVIAGRRARHRGGDGGGAAGRRRGDRRRRRAREGGLPGLARGRARRPLRAAAPARRRARGAARGPRRGSRRATPASRSATRAARWAWSSRPSATTPGAPERNTGQDDPGRGRRRHDVPRAARRRRPDHALELPAHDRGAGSSGRRWPPGTRSC